MGNMYSEIPVQIEGHLKIVSYQNEDDVGDSERGEILLDKRNAIHQEHASIIIARSLANRENGFIHSMHFGNGGATIDPLGNITYSTPNTTGAADLNIPTYFEVVDDTQDAPEGNQMAVRHINGTLFSDVEIRCLMEKSEPFGQAAFDNVGGTNINESIFVFDEIGLKTQDGLLVTHVTFSPIEKSANRIVEVVYTLRVSIFE